MVHAAQCSHYPKDTRRSLVAKEWYVSWNNYHKHELLMGSSAFYEEEHGQAHSPPPRMSHKPWDWAAEEGSVSENCRAEAKGGVAEGEYQVSEKLMILFWRIRVVWKRRMSSWYVNILFIFFSLGSLSFRNIIHSYGFSVIIITQPLSVSWSSGPVSRTGDITASGREWWERGTESSTWGIANESQGQPSLN